MDPRYTLILDKSNISDKDIEAYSYNGSLDEKKPALIIWPETTQQISKTLHDANQTRTKIIIRGSGTNPNGASIGEGITILSTERMNKILGFDLSRKRVVVQCGVRLSDLKQRLSAAGLAFPLTFYNEHRTCGSLAAIDPEARESAFFGKVSKYIESVEFVDGTGKVFDTSKINLVCGREGASGIVTKITFKLDDCPEIKSADMLSTTEPIEVLKEARVRSNDDDLVFIDVYDKQTSNMLGFGRTYNIIMAYKTTKGKIKIGDELREKIDLFANAKSRLWSAGYLRVTDIKVSLDKSYDLLEYCQQQDMPIFGFASSGLYFVHSIAPQSQLISFVKGIGGTIGSAFGKSRVGKDFIKPEDKKELVRLKDEHDYNNILNTNMLIDYR